jgi:hypothetical protein
MLKLGWFPGDKRIKAETTMIHPSIIESKFLRYKSVTPFIRTKTWKETDDIIKSTILQLVDFDINENPIIVYYQDNLYWWLITNNALYISDTIATKYQFKEIESIDIASLWNGKATKTEIPSIDIYWKDDKIDLLIEPLTWPVISQILKFCIRKRFS